MRLIMPLCICLALAAPATANADKATAQALFDEGRALMAKGDFAQACPKLEESQKQDPGMGTLFRLAECYEGLGRTATAWATFLEVADLATTAGLPDREKVARERAEKLANKLSRLTITAPKIEGLVVKRDGAELGTGQLGASLPVDPGKHHVEASAPGRKPFSKTVEVGKDGAKASVEIPELPPDAPVASSSARRGVGLVVAGIGILSVGASVFVGLSARSTWRESDAHCEGNLCDAQGLAFRDAGRDRGNIATILFTGGAVLGAAGLVLFLTAPRSESAASGSLHVGVGVGSVLLGGTF